MSAGPDSRHEPLSPDEQALAARLVQWKTGEPDTSLDRMILAQARSAVSTPAQPTQRSHQRPWLVGLASAATFVFAVGLIWRVAEQAPEPLAEMARGQPSAASAGESAEVAFSEPPAPMDAPHAPAAAPADSDALGGSAGDAASAWRQAESLAGDARIARDVDVPNPAGSAAATPDQPPTVVAAPRSAPAPREASPVIAQESEFVPPPAPPPPPRQEQAAPSAVQPSTEPPRVVSRSRALADQASATSDAQRMPGKQAAPAAPQSDHATAPVDPFPADGGSPHSDSRGQMRIRGDDLEQAPADFQRAVVRIRRLIAEGRTDRALTAIERLRQRHPDQALPDDLRRFAAGMANEGR